jgi:hypothetical protein
MPRTLTLTKRAGSLLAVLVVLAAALTLNVRVASAAASPVRSESSSATAQAKVLRYWTKARLRHAVPVDGAGSRTPFSTPSFAATDRGKPTSVAPSGVVFDSLARLAGKIGETRLLRGTVSGTRSMWTAPMTDMPARTFGKVFFTDPGDGNDYVCSGTVINAENKSVVWTAGHCVHEGTGATGRWMQNWVFVPAYQDGTAPYGAWTRRELWTTTNWVKYESPRYDLGAAVLQSLNGQRIADVVGGEGIAFSQPLGQAYMSFGYPAEAPFDGEHLFLCQSPYGGPDYPGRTAGPATIRIACDMTGGSSGGGWLAGFNGTWGYVVSVNSYGKTNETGTMYGPYMGNTAKSLFDKIRNR